MIANRERSRRPSRTSRGLGLGVGRLTAAGIMTALASIILHAAAEPARLVGVTAQGDALLIESTEPAAYSVTRPDPLTLVVDMRNVSVSNARSDVPRQGAIAGVRLEQATAVDGRAVARVHVSLTRPSQHTVRSARNTIRVELTPRPGPAAASVKTSSSVPAPAAVSAPKPAQQRPPAAAAAIEPAIEKKSSGVATVLERIQSHKTPSATTVTLSGNGHLSASGVIESKDLPRRLVLDFPNVSSKAPTHTTVDSALVSRVRVGLNSHQPLVTRVVMEIAGTASYHVERSGDAGRDLAVVFEAGKSGATVVLAPADPSASPVEPDPPVTLQQAVANVASITPREPIANPAQPVDAMAALNTASPAATPPASAPPVPASPAPVAVRPEAEPQAVPASSETAIRPEVLAALTRPETAAVVTKPDASAVLSKPQAPAATGTATPQSPAAESQLPQTIAAQSSPTEARAPEVPVARQQTAPATPQPPAEQQQQRRQFTGHAISLDFEGVDLRAVLRTFADVSGLNMVIDPDVQGTVDIKLTDVPWDQALDVILRGNQLDYTVDGTIVRISRIKTLEDENKARQAAATAAAERAAQANGLAFETYPLSYAKAAELAPLLKGSLRLSKHGQVQVDARTNTLIIADLPDKFPAIRELLRALDRAEPQVEVEARIVQTTRDFAKAIGVQWGLNGRVMPDVGNTTNLAFPNRGTLGGRLGTQGPTDPRASELEQTGSAVRLGVPDASSAIGLALGAVNGAFNLDVALSALERTGKGRVLSTPRLTTQNNIQAEVAQGVQIPIQVVNNNTVTVSFKDAVLVLRVTPQITAAGTVIMKVEIENATADFSRQVNGIPPVDTQRALTQVQIDDGATTVIGGIFVSQEQSTSDKTPVLHRIPILGWLFKQDRFEDESRELLIFITPRILKG
jgi:type IV pilus secretin PilQ/predicted competence protein